MKKQNIALAGIISILLCSCVTLKPPIIAKHDTIERFKYMYISPTTSLTSSSGATYNGQYYSTSKSVNPRDVISGFLAKNGFIILPEVKPELANQTLIVNYGESGRRYLAGGLFGYTTEVTIQFISPISNELLFSCTAEGIGATEADDIREAITRSLTELLAN